MANISSVEAHNPMLVNAFQESLNPEKPKDNPEKPKKMNPLYLPFLGAGLGYVAYCGARLFTKIGLYKPAGPIEPLPYVIFVGAMLTVPAIAQALHSLALSIFGERESVENSNDADAQSVLDRFRKHSWKVIGPIQDIPKKIDAIYSRTFKIATMEEIHQKDIKGEDLYLSEIIRQVFIEQIKSLPAIAVPPIAALTAEALGYPFFTREKMVYVVKINIAYRILTLAIKPFMIYGGSDEDRINRRVTIDLNFQKKLEAEKKTNDDKSVAVNADPRKIENID